MLIRVARYAVALMALIALMAAEPASADDIDAALQKANVYIETAKITERAIESWERYQSWVNLKAGPTGKERYISYGMYDVYDAERLEMEIRAVASAKPGKAYRARREVGSLGEVMPGQISFSLA